MPRHHYLPASLIGGFSADTSVPNARDRYVWTAHHRQRKPVQRRASKLGYVNNLYALSTKPDNGRELVDDTWSIYESDLPAAIDELLSDETSSVAARTWLYTLVPFVTGLFVRGLDFSGRFTSRLPNSELNDTEGKFPDSGNGARLMEFQRLLAPLMAAEWIVISTPRESVCISNESGLSPLRAPGCPLGWAVPLRPNAVLAILPSDHRTIAFHDGEAWRATIERDVADVAMIESLNETLARRAQQFIFGPTQESVSERIRDFRADTRDVSDTEMAWPFSARMMRVHELEWHRALAAIEKDPQEVDRTFDIDWDLIPSDMPVFLATNLPDFTSGLHLRGRGLHLAMSRVPGFTDVPLDAPLPWDEDGYPEVTDSGTEEKE